MRSYHFFDVQYFTLFDEREEGDTVSTIQQLSLEGNDDEPVSSIKLIKRDYYRGFDKFIIHHEKIKKKRGRAYGEDLFFNQYVETNSLNGYYHPNLSLFIFQGNKPSVNDFVKKIQEMYPENVKLTRSSVDFPYLIQHTQNVWGGWLNGFNDGNLKSVALYGDHVDLSQDYNRYQAAGKLSSLNCSIVFEKTSYDFMITANKTVVIMQNRTPEEDLDLLLFMKPLLYKEPI